jgi:hypothetical protein
MIMSNKTKRKKASAGTGKTATGPKEGNSRGERWKLTVPKVMMMAAVMSAIIAASTCYIHQQRNLPIIEVDPEPFEKEDTLVRFRPDTDLVHIDLRFRISNKGNGIAYNVQTPDNVSMSLRKDGKILPGRQEQRLIGESGNSFMAPGRQILEELTLNIRTSSPLELVGSIRTKGFKFEYPVYYASKMAFMKFKHKANYQFRIYERKVELIESSTK